MLPLSAMVAWISLLGSDPTAPDPSGWADLLTRGGLLGGSLLIVYALLTDRLVSGARHRREIAARDREIELWRSAALRSSESLERVSSVFFPPSPAPLT